MFEQKRSKSPVALNPSLEKIRPNNSALLEKILNLHPDIEKKIRAIVFKRLRQEGSQSSVDAEDVVQKIFLKFIRTHKPPQEDWPLERILAWMIVLINHTILDLYNTDGDNHKRINQAVRTRTIQFASPDETREERRGTSTDGELIDSKGLSPEEELLAEEKTPEAGLLDRIKNMHPRIRLAVTRVLGSPPIVTEQEQSIPTKNHIQEARIIVLRLRNPELSEEEFTKKILESLNDEYIDPVLIKRHYYGEENFIAAISALPNEQSRKIVKWYYLDYLSYKKNS